MIANKTKTRYLAFLPILFFIHLLFFVSSALATTYYVAKDGDDNNPGTLDAPWKTIHRANVTLQAGDIVCIRGGTYKESIRPTRFGTSESNRITYKNYQEEEAILQGGTGRLVGWEKDSGEVGVNAIYKVELSHKPQFGIFEDDFETAGRYCATWNKDTGARGSANRRIDGPGQFLYRNGYIYMRTSDGKSPDDHYVRAITSGARAITLNANYITVDGIKVRDWKNWCEIRKGYHHNVVKNCDMQFAGWSGFHLEGSYNKILNNTFKGGGSWMSHEGETINMNAPSNDGNYNLIQDNDMSYGAHSLIQLKGNEGLSCFGNIFRANYLHDSGGTIIQIRNGKFCLIEGNKIVRAPNVAEVGPGHRVSHNGLALTEGSNIIVRYNFMYENGAEGMSISGGAHHIYVYHNVIYDNRDGIATGGRETRDLFFKNNIICQNRRYALFLDSPPDALANDLIFRNNLIRKSESDDIIAHIFGHGNLNSLSRIQRRFSQFSNNIDDDPLFVDGKNHDFSLQPKSSCIDKGEFLTSTKRAGRGNQIEVNDAGYFFTGFEILDADLIQLKAQKNSARVVEIDYEKNILTIDRPLSWLKGQGIGFLYSGRGPDIGAREIIKEE